MKQVVQNRDWLIRRAIQGAPHEVCGFIFTDGSVVEIPNAAADPSRGFAMSQLHLCNRVPQPELVVALWHSHPNGNATPSENDLKCAELFADWRHFIVTPDDIHEYESTG